MKSGRLFLMCWHDSHKANCRDIKKHKKLRVITGKLKHPEKTKRWDHVSWKTSQLS